MSSVLTCLKRLSSAMAREWHLGRGHGGRQPPPAHGPGTAAQRPPGSRAARGKLSESLTLLPLKTTCSFFLQNFRSVLSLSSWRLGVLLGNRSEVLVLVWAKSIVYLKNQIFPQFSLNFSLLFFYCPSNYSSFSSGTWGLHVPHVLIRYFHFFLLLLWVVRCFFYMIFQTPHFSSTDF